MRKSTIAIVVLASALLVSNLYWLYYFIDAGVSYGYLADSHRVARDTARQALALLPVAATPDINREELIAAASKLDPQFEPFEKEGFAWVGAVGLRFDEDGRLVEARPSVEPL
jgi:hypothetical protein